MMTKYFKDFVNEDEFLQINESFIKRTMDNVSQDLRDAASVYPVGENEEVENEEDVEEVNQGLSFNSKSSEQPPTVVGL